MHSLRCALGLDFGTGGVRALLVDVDSGRELAVATADYGSGDHGVLSDAKDPDVARQHPGDWLLGLQQATRSVLEQARAERGFTPATIVGIGVDATGSTPLPVDARVQPLACAPEFHSDLAAQAWLWKDHSAHAEAAEITARAVQDGRPWLSFCGGRYSSEWFWSKVLRCERTAPHVARAAAGWLECCDFVPAWLCGIRELAAVPRSLCAAGHKAMYHRRWQGWPDADWLGGLGPGLPRVRAGMSTPAQPSQRRAGLLAAAPAASMGLPAGIPVAVGALDAHLGAVGSGVRAGTMVKILGTSTCDCLVLPLARELPAIPGIAGIAEGSILPDHHGIEAGQSAVGDIFQWFAERIAPSGFGHGEAAHAALTQAAACSPAGASGLLALDWHNGNRCVLADPRLSGMVLGLSLHTTPPELYRAWIEATAFGARMILDRLAEHGIAIERIVTCGGIAEKNPLLMQIYADVCERPLASARSAQACALGAAIMGSVAGGAHPDVPTAQRAMIGEKTTLYTPEPVATAVYRRLFALYRRVHDAFGGVQEAAVGSVMKELLAIRDGARRAP